MAEEKKKSQAQMASSAKQSGKSKSSAKNHKPADAKSKTQPQQTQIPVRLITSCVCLALFLLFLVMFLNPEGALVVFLMNIIQGLIGKASFYIAIPALLYLFVIQAFSGKRPVIMRSVCMISFVLICGCISQLFLDTALPKGFSVLATLYQGGSAGTAAGLLCGGISLLIKALLGWWITLILCFVAAALTLGG